MVHILMLWLPIVVSSVFVFIASSVIHMALKYHQNDYGRLPDEAAAADALRKLNIPPGLYIMPHAASSSAMNDPVRRAQVVAAVGKVGKAEQIAEAAAWLISPNADFVHGSCLIADGGVLMH